MNVKIVYMCTCAILDENLWPIWIVDRAICLCILSFNKYFLNSYFLLGLSFLWLLYIFEMWSVSSMIPFAVYILLISGQMHLTLDSVLVIIRELHYPIKTRHQRMQVPPED